jgi:hypothetical protein
MVLSTFRVVFLLAADHMPVLSGNALPGTLKSVLY